MTNNKLLLFRLAELMLEQEQYVLLVDNLFDDEQIGDNVKSIQIDSPYQQMIIEGVLTESIQNEMLYVSFTVEGFFHFILGEVIYHQSSNKESSYLNNLLHHNRLNGIKEGVEQCLIKDVQKFDLSRLMWLIDNGVEYTDICYVPLAQSFLIQNFTAKSDEEHYDALRNKIEFIIGELFTDFNQNDVLVLEKTIDYLYDLQKHSIIEIIYAILNEILKPNNDINQAILSLDGISYLSPEFRLEKIKKLQKIKFLDNQPEITEFYFSLGNEYRKISQYDEALKMYRKALRYLRSIADSDKLLLIDYYNYSGLIWNYKGVYSKAIIYFNKALKILSNLPDNNFALISTCYNNLGSSWDNKGNHKKAIYFLEKSLDYRLRNYGKNHPKTATIFNNLGLAYKNISKYKTSLNLLEEALEIRIKVFGENHKSTAVSLNNIGLAYSSAEKLSSAVVYLEKSLKIRLNIHGKNHPSTHLTYKNLITTLLGIDQIEKAENYFDRLYHNYNIFYSGNYIKMAELSKIKSKILIAKGEFINAINCLESYLVLHLNESNSKLNSIEIADCYMKIGDIWCQEGDFNMAIKKYKIALKYRLSIKEEDGTDVQISLTYENIGSALEQIGNWVEALDYYKKALEINLKIHGEVHVSTSTNYLNLASTFESQNDFENSLTYYKKCLEIDLLTLGNEHPYTRASYFFVGRVSKKINNHIMALDAFNDALRIDLHHHGVEHEDTLTDYKMIANCWLSEGNIIKALENFKKALEISIILNGNTHSETIEIEEQVKSLKNQ
jgi:tetratricopeptide (TPR) repeat protein